MIRRAFALPVMALLLLAAGDPRTASEWVVESGQTLRGIANRTGVDVRVIAAANGIAEPYDVRIGQRLVIPRQRSHVVKDGETALGIALRYKVSLTQLTVANSLPEDGAVKIGQRLIIPAVLPDGAATLIKTPTRPNFARPHDGSVLLGWKRGADGKGHEGVDFAVQTGDMIRASASGTVLSAGPRGARFGNMVVIDHGNGWHTAYGNLARVTVKAGEPVRAGERIGIGGKSGAATRPEVHFEVRRGGNPVNPAPLLGIN